MNHHQVPQWSLFSPSEPFVSWNWIDLKRPNRTVTLLCSWSPLTRKPSTDEPWLLKVYRWPITIALVIVMILYLLTDGFCVGLHPRTTCQPALTSRKSSVWTLTSGRLSRSLRRWRACWGRAWWTTLHTHQEYVIMLQHDFTVWIYQNCCTVSIRKKLIIGYYLQVWWLWTHAALQEEKDFESHLLEEIWCAEMEMTGVTFWDNSYRDNQIFQLCTICDVCKHTTEYTTSGCFSPKGSCEGTCDLLLALKSHSYYDTM